MAVSDRSSPFAFRTSNSFRGVSPMPSAMCGTNERVLVKSMVSWNEAMERTEVRM